MENPCIVATCPRIIRRIHSLLKVFGSYPTVEGSIARRVFSTPRVYVLRSRIDHLDYVPRYKRLLQKYDRGIWNLSWEEIGKITDGCAGNGGTAGGEKGAAAPSGCTNRPERNKISPWMLSIPRKPITGYTCNRICLRSLGLRVDS